MANPEPDSEVVKLQCPIKVYPNKNGGVTIAQDQTGMMGVDVFVHLNTKDAVQAVIAALQSELDEWKI